MRRRDRRVRDDTTTTTTLLTMPAVDLRAIGADPALVFIVDDPSLLVRPVFEGRLDIFVDGSLTVRSRHRETHLAYRAPRRRVVRQQSASVRGLRRGVDVSRSAAERARERAERSSGDQHSRRVRLVRCESRGGGGQGGCSRHVHDGQSRWRERPIVIVNATTTTTTTTTITTGDGVLLLNGMLRVSVVGVHYYCTVAVIVAGRGDGCATGGGIEVGRGVVRWRGGWPRERRDRIVLRHRPTSQFKMLDLATRRCVHATLPVLLLLLRLQLLFLLPVIREMDTVTELSASFCSCSSAASTTSTSSSFPFSSSSSASASQPNSTRRRDDPPRRSCCRSPCCFWRGW